MDDHNPTLQEVHCEADEADNLEDQVPATQETQDDEAAGDHAPAAHETHNEL